MSKTKAAIAIVDGKDKKDPHFHRNRNALVVLLLIEAARQGDQASNGEFRNVQ